MHRSVSYNAELSRECAEKAALLLLIFHLKRPNAEKTTLLEGRRKQCLFRADELRDDKKLLVRNADLLDFPLAQESFNGRTISASIDRCSDDIDGNVLSSIFQKNCSCCLFSRSRSETGDLLLLTFPPYTISSLKLAKLMLVQ